MNEIHQGRVFAVQSIGPLPASKFERNESTTMTEMTEGVTWSISEPQAVSLCFDALNELTYDVYDISPRSSV